MSTFYRSTLKVLVYICLVWTFFAVNLPGVTSQVTLTAVSLEPGQSACPGENVTFNCIVNASQALSWGSDEYIGTGGEQLEFSYLDRIGRKIPSRINPGTFAILINVTNNSGIYSLESELYLVVDVFNQDSTISCLTIETNDSMQINILEDDPGMPQNAAAVEIPTTPDHCVILIEWSPPNNINSPNIDYYIIQTSNKNEIPTVNETSTLATFLSPCEELNNLFINITTVDRCEHVGVSTANFRPRLVTVVTNSSMTSTQLSTTTSNSGPDLERIVMITTFSSAAAVLAIISSVVLFGIIFCVYRLCLKCKNKNFGELEFEAGNSSQHQPSATYKETKQETEGDSNSTGKTEQSPLNNRSRGTGSSPTNYGVTSSSDSTNVNESLKKRSP